MKIWSRPWLVHLGVAAALGAFVWLADRATGSHLAQGLNAFALNLAVWYEDRRIPTVLCSPKTPVAYDRAAGVTFEVPQCWHTESTSLFDKEVHRFFDPDARAGVVSVSVDPIESDEDRQAFRAEFDQLASRPGAQVGDGADGNPDGARRIHSAADSLAERFMDDAGAGAQQAAAAAGPFRSVESVGVIGPSDQPSPELSGERFATRPSEGAGPRRAWSWLLLSDHEAVRVVYTVREDWVGEAAITGELKRVRKMIQSVKPRF